MEKCVVLLILLAVVQSTLDGSYAHMFTSLRTILIIKIPTSIGGVNKHRFVFCSLLEETECLASEAVKSAALSFESVDSSRAVTVFLRACSV